MGEDIDGRPDSNVIVYLDDRGYEVLKGQDAGSKWGFRAFLNGRQLDVKSLVIGSELTTRGAQQHMVLREHNGRLHCSSDGLRCPPEFDLQEIIGSFLGR